MSRSYRKRPFIGNCVVYAGEEKEDKRRARKKLRRHERMIEADLENNLIDPDEVVFPVENEISDPWLFAKDGKQRFDTDERPQLRRK